MPDISISGYNGMQRHVDRVIFGDGAVRRQKPDHLAATGRFLQ
jgi:hypothetical protein